MKRISIFYFSLAAIAAGSLASCQDYEPFDEATVREAAVIKEFTKNFETRYGKIDPNHTWGFQDIVITSGIQRKAATRAAGDDLVQGMVDPTDPNQYNWTHVYGVTPPGAPDGWDGANNQTQAGAVTAEEIFWVSEYFRTHSYEDMIPKMVKLHLTDFFIEEVSADDDQNEYIGVHGEGKAITKIDESTNINYHMDQLIARTMDSDPNDFHTWHHINNMNAGNAIRRPQQYADDSYYTPKDSESHRVMDLAADSRDRNRVIQFVHSSGTEDFGYHPSWDNSGADFYTEYVLVHLSFDVNGHHYEGNYLAFDFEANDGAHQVGPDGRYSNWIMKITPANYVPSPTFPVNRIFCEDLGNTHDFDFNDLVFDVKYEAVYTDGIPTHVEAVLVIQASGGTLPIWVGQKDNNHEAHFLLGSNDTGIPINVGANPGKTHDVAIIRETLTQGTQTQYENEECGWYYTGTAYNTQIFVNPNNINIWVGANTASLVSNATLLPASGKGDKVAPQKISIPYSDTRWLKESQQIEWGYGYFDAWVKDENSYGYFVNGVRNANAWTQLHNTTSSDPNGGTEESHLY